MKRLFILIFTLFYIHNTKSQTIRDTIFNDVVLIKKENITTNDYDFLIDIPIESQVLPITIFNNDRRILTKMFFERKSFLPKQNEIFLITPDWKFLNEIREKEKKYGMHIKAMRQKIYHIQRDSTNYKVDSLVINIYDFRKPIKLNFKKFHLKDNEKKYFYKWCQKATLNFNKTYRNIRKKRLKNIKLFDKNNNVKISKNVYRLRMGKYFKYCDYYTLSDLSNKQKIDFLRQEQEIENPRIKNISKFPVIILPATINSKDLIQKNSKK